MTTAPRMATAVLSKPAPSREEGRAAPRRKHDYEWGAIVPMMLAHVFVFGAIWSGVTWEALVVMAVMFFTRIWLVTGVYHRYFAHRTYQMSRPLQFILAFLAQTSCQRGVLWWAAHHRRHHLHSDQEGDLHSVRQDGFWHAHMMWIFDRTSDTDWKRIQDFAKYPELRFINKYWLLPPVVAGLTIWGLFGWSGLFIGFFAATVLNWHATYFINSLCHVWGKRRFETKDDSKNNFWLALLTMGEGWHNNHHHYMNSCRNGFYWWEIDITYYVIKAMSWVGLVWGIKEPPARILEDGRRRDAERKAAKRAAKLAA